jgi:hypothetical protein
MTRKLNKVKESLRPIQNFAAGVFIGSASITPVFAADMTLDTMRMPILLGSFALLVIGLVLKAMRRKTPHEASTPPEFNEGIGRYRLQLGRGGAD